MAWHGARLTAHERTAHGSRAVGGSGPVPCIVVDTPQRGDSADGVSPWRLPPRRNRSGIRRRRQQHSALALAELEITLETTLEITIAPRELALPSRLRVGAPPPTRRGRAQAGDAVSTVPPARLIRGGTPGRRRHSEDGGEEQHKAARAPAECAVRAAGTRPAARGARGPEMW